MGRPSGQLMRRDSSSGDIVTADMISERSRELAFLDVPGRADRGGCGGLEVGQVSLDMSTVPEVCSAVSILGTEPGGRAGGVPALGQV